MLDDEKLLKVLPMLRQEYAKACEKHPEFGNFYTDAVSIITEELGELAKEINEGSFEFVPGWRDRAITEAAHVAVTAIRMMQKLMEEKLAE